MNYASIANKLIAKSGPAIRKAGEKLGGFLLRPEGAVQRIARDTLAYTAAEQGVPRLLGVQAPPIQETLIRQAGGNIVAEGVTAGLGKAFPGTGAMIGYKKGGQQYFRPSGITPRLARGIGEFTGQVAGKQLAQAVLPGNQQYPFLNTPEGYTKHDWDMQTHSFVPEGVEQRVEHGGTLSAERPASVIYVASIPIYNAPRPKLIINKPIICPNPFIKSSFQRFIKPGMSTSIPAIKSSSVMPISTKAVITFVLMTVLTPTIPAITPTIIKAKRLACFA